MRFKQRAWTRVDWALAAICAFLVYGIMAKGWARHVFPMSVLPVGPWAAPLLALLVAVPVALRRRDPVGAFLLGLVGCALIITAGGQITRGAFLPLALVLYTVAATRTRTVAAASLAACLVLLVVQGFILSMMGNGSGPATGVALILIIAWMIGSGAQQRRAYAARTREQVAKSAVTEERLRIARELHDVVAHSMTVVAVQAGFGEYVFDSEPAQARAALGNIQHVTREALSDMQRLLGVLRQDGNGQPGPAAPPGQPDGDRPTAPARQLQLAPAPGLADLERLVSTTAGAGVRVALTRTGDRRDIPAAIDQSAFRIVQEALTNVVKHSGASTCQVIIGYEPDGLTVEITDPGSGQGPRDEVAGAAGQRGFRGSPPGSAHGGFRGGLPPRLATGQATGGPHAADGTGHGILGMRERVSLCGGEFTAGPRPGDGFEVIAHFPLPALPQRRLVQAAEVTIAEAPPVHATALPRQAR
jgi:signal transduction histidine kinase